MLPTLKHWLGDHLCSLFMVAIASVQFISSVSANERPPVLFPRAPSRLDPIGLVIHSLEQRSPADNTSFGAGFSRVALSGDRQYVLSSFLLWQNAIQISTMQNILYGHPSWRGVLPSCTRHGLGRFMAGFFGMFDGPMQEGSSLSPHLLQHNLCAIS